MLGMTDEKVMFTVTFQVDQISNNKKDVTEHQKTACAHCCASLNVKGHCFCSFLTFYLSEPSITVVTSTVEGVCVCCKWLTEQWTYCRKQLCCANCLLPPSKPPSLCTLPVYVLPQHRIHTSLSDSTATTEQNVLALQSLKKGKYVKSCGKSNILWKRELSERNFHYNPGRNSITYLCSSCTSFPLLPA